MSYDILINKTIFKKYKITKLLGKGSFGCVFQGTNLIDNSEIAIKIEKKNSKSHLLETESNFLSLLKGFGIPEIKSYGRFGNFYILVEEILGPNLNQIKNIQSFTLKDIAMIGIQIIDRIEYVHSKGIIHRDIKPENFTIGYKNDSTIYIIDFGIARKYKSSRTGKHLRFKITGKLFGTVRYISYNASRGVEQSRRDDLVSIGYMLLYLCGGKLPWQGLRLKDINTKKKYLEMLYLKKYSIPERLCKGLPIEFVEYIKYCRDLSFEQDPNYDYLRSRFRTILFKMNTFNDLNFTWLENDKFKLKKKSKIKKVDIKSTNYKYINFLKRKQSPHIRLYQAIQKSLEKDEKSLKCLKRKSILSFEEKKILKQNNNINVHNRGVSEDCIMSKRENLNVSKDLISYESHKAQYDMDVKGFEDEKKVEQLYKERGRNIFFFSASPSTSPSLPKYQKNISSIKNKGNKIDYKYSDSNSKNISYALSKERNKKQNKITKKQLYHSIDLDKIDFTEKISTNDNKMHCKSENIRINKKIFNNDKKRACPKNININKEKEPLNKEIIEKGKIIEKNDIAKINDSKIINKVERNLLNKFNEGEGFSFKNWPLIKDIKINKKSDNNTSQNINNIFEKKKTITKDISNNLTKNNNNKMNKDLNNKNFKKVELYNDDRRTKNNSNNINFINSFLKNKYLRNKREINIIINNNVNSFSKKILNKKQNYNKQILKSENNYGMRFNTERFGENQIYTNNDQIIENDCKSYHYINKIPINNTKKIFKLIHNEKNNNAKISHYYYPFKKNETDNINLSNRILIKAYKSKKLENKKNLQYTPIYKTSIQNNIIKNTTISRINRDTKNKNINNNTNYTSSFSHQEKSFTVGEMKVIKSNNNKTKEYQIKKPTKYESNKIISNENYNNKEKITIKNNEINIGNFTHRNNFSSNIEPYNCKKQYFKNEYGKIYLKNRRKIHLRLSPDNIKKKSFLDYDLDNKIVDNLRLLTYRSTSNNNNKKRVLNYNSEYIQEFEDLSHIPKNINNLNRIVNRIDEPKCLNSFII